MELTLHCIARLQMSEVALLIFDEAHHAVKRHPYNLIMQEFYHQVQIRWSLVMQRDLVHITVTLAAHTLN